MPPGGAGTKTLHFSKLSKKLSNQGSTFRSLLFAGINFSELGM